MKTKSKIEEQLKKKTNSDLVKTIIAAKKAKGWLKVAGIAAGPRRNHSSVNLSEINKEAKDNDIIVIPGKVLSIGEIDKKIKVVALNFSGKAKEKIKKSGAQAVDMIDEIKSNPEAKGVKILK